MIETKELTGAALDWMVAKAIGQEVKITPEFSSRTDGTQHAGFCCFAPGGRRPYKPSTDWAQGGPLIERFSIEISPCGAGVFVAEVWIDNGEEASFGVSRSQSVLEAVCRAVVKAKFGDVVSVPEELL